ncbi:MAG: transketolase [Deltaproteobacteria bacterium]
MNNDIEYMKNLAREMRRDIFRMAYKAGGGHIAPAFSIVEILTAVYMSGVLKHDPERPDDPRRDRFILSKGHASAALYAVLAQAGYLDRDELDLFCQEGSILGGHPNMLEIPGVEASTGALGHGLGFATGIALAGKLDKEDYQVYVVVGDGECQEGSIWEAALFAASQNLNNLTVILDYNKLQAMDRLDKIIRMEPFAEKWKGFGWEVQEVDGHDIAALIESLGPNESQSPRIIIAHTIKGKGVSFMEGVPIWHFRLPDDEELKIVLRDLEMDMQELMGS